MSKSVNEMAEQCKKDGTVGVGKASMPDGTLKVLLLLPLARQTEGGDWEEQVVSLAIDDAQALLLAEKLLLSANSSTPGWVEGA